MRLSPLFLFGAAALLINFVDCQELTSTLQTSDIYGVPVAYDGENVIFTCVTRGSRIIAWSSEEQIGSGGRRLDLAFVQPIGTSVTAGKTIATLISVSDNSGSVVIVSQLQISVSSTYQTSSVTCHSVGIDTQNTTLFYMADEVSLQCDNYCPGEAVTCTCTVASSSTLSWISEEYIGRGSSLQFTSNDTVPSMLNTTVPGADARLTKISNTNGVFVITSEITILSSSNNIILTCHNVGRSGSRTAIISINDDCASPLATSVSSLMTTSHSISDTDPTTGTAIPDLNKNSAVVAIAVTSSLLTIIVVILLVLTLKLWFRNKSKSRKEDKCQTELDDMSAETHVCQKDTQLVQQTIIQNLNTPVRKKDERLSEKDERVREKDERLREKDERPKKREEEERKKSQLRRKDEEIHRKDADISRLQRELQIMQESLERATLQSGAELTGRTGPKFVPRHYKPPLQTCLYGFQVSQFVQATQLFSRDHELMVCFAGTIFLYTAEAEIMQESAERAILHSGAERTGSPWPKVKVSPLEEATQPFSNELEITITDLRTENKTLTKKVGDLQAEIKVLNEEMRHLQTENERLREKESVNETVVQEKYTKLNMVDDVFGVMETDITFINYKAKEAHLVAQEMSNKKEILDDEVVQLKAELIDVKHPQDHGAGAMVCNVIKLKSTRDGDDIKDYKTFKKDKK